MKGKNTEKFLLFGAFSNVCDLFLMNSVFDLILIKYTQKEKKESKVSYALNFNNKKCNWKDLTSDFSCCRYL